MADVIWCCSCSLPHLPALLQSSGMDAGCFMSSVKFPRDLLRCAHHHLLICSPEKKTAPHECNWASLFAPILPHSPLWYPLHRVHSFSCWGWSDAPCRKERLLLARTFPATAREQEQTSLPQNQRDFQITQLSTNKACPYTPDTVPLCGVEHASNTEQSRSTGADRQNPSSTRFQTDPCRSLGSHRTVSGPGRKRSTDMLWAHRVHSLA